MQVEGDGVLIRVDQVGVERNVLLDVSGVFGTVVFQPDKPFSVHRQNSERRFVDFDAAARRLYVVDKQRLVSRVLYFILDIQFLSLKDRVVMAVGVDNAQGGFLVLDVASRQDQDREYDQKFGITRFHAVDVFNFLEDILRRRQVNFWVGYLAGIFLW